MHSPHQGERARGNQSPLAKISTGTVRLFRKYTGRGPDRASTRIDGDLAIVVLRNTLTIAERELVAVGHEADVLSMRSATQQAMRDELVALVEEQLGRKVEGFSSHNSVEPDMAIEVFVLDGRNPRATSPSASDEKQRSEAGAEARTPRVQPSRTPPALLPTRTRG